VALAVEPSNDRFADSCRFDGIRGVDHALRQAGQFASGQMPLSVELISKADDTSLLFGIEPLDFLDDLAGRHRRRRKFIAPRTVINHDDFSLRGRKAGGSFRKTASKLA